jgi:hypothetical protein
VPGTPPRAPNLELHEQQKRLMLQEPYQVNVEARQTVLDSIKAVCAKRCWQLIAAHIRTNHVHLVIYLETTPVLAMGTCKACATLALLTLA